MVEHIRRELLRLGVSQVLTQPVCIEAGLVHADQTDGGEVIGEGAEVPLGVRVQTVIQQLGDDGALDLQGARRDVHHVIQSLIEVLLVAGLVGEGGDIDGHDADRAGGLAAAEVAARLLTQLAQVKPQAAAHGAHVAGLHIAVDVVGEVGGSVLGGHLEQEAVVLGVRPVEITGDGVGGDGVLEAATVGIPLDHGLDEGLVDNVHLALAILVLEVHLLAANDAVLLGQIRRDDPVQRDVGKGCLRAPTGGGIDAEDERLDALLDGIIAEVIGLDEGSQIGIEGGEGLCARPLVLHDTQEVDHLVTESRQVLGGSRGDLTGHTAQTLLDQLLERPSGAVAGQHGEVMQVDVGVAVCLGDLLVVDLAQPVVGGDGTGVGQDQAADRVGDGGVLLDPPVVDLEVVIHDLLVVEERVAHVAHTLPLLAVEDVGLGDLVIAGLDQDRLHAVLNVLDRDAILADLGLEIRRDLECQKIDGVLVVLEVTGIEGFDDGVAYLAQIEVDDLAVAFCHRIHDVSPFVLIGLSFIGVARLLPGRYTGAEPYA